MATMTDPSVFTGHFNPEFSLGSPPRDEDCRVVFERGLKDQPRVFIEHDPADKDWRKRMSVPQDFVYHSPDGFEWGYGGSGPSDLALNLLCEFVDPPTAWRLHNSFKFDFIADLPDEGGAIPVERIYSWLEDKFEEHAG